VCKSFIAYSVKPYVVISHLSVTTWMSDCSVFFASLISVRDLIALVLPRLLLQIIGKDYECDIQCIKYRSTASNVSHNI
jgi:hypothetical protein